MIEKWLMLGLICVGGALVFATPWFVVIAGIYEARTSKEVEPISWMVCLFLCVWEIGATADWAFGLGSLPF